MKGLDRNAPSVPPQNSPQEAQQVEMWKKYIQWEKSNPLRTEDQTLITKRGEPPTPQPLRTRGCPGGGGEAKPNALGSNLMVHSPTCVLKPVWLSKLSRPPLAVMHF